MYLLDGDLVLSARDLRDYTTCQFATLRALDARLGRIEKAPPAADAMLERLAELGGVHERRALAELTAEYGADAIVEMPRPDPTRRSSLERAAAATLAAMRDGARVVYQATLFDSRFLGYADFLIRDDDGAWQVHDTKLARTASVHAVLQTAAYADILRRAGVVIADAVTIRLGDGKRHVHDLRDIVPVYVEQRRMVETRLAARLTAAAPVEWGDDEVGACGQCDRCVEQIAVSDDLFAVAGLSGPQRVTLHRAGIRTVSALAGSDGDVQGIGREAMRGLRAQARVQVLGSTDGVPAFEVASPERLAALPAPDPGDLFFDFEGDPLYTEGEGAEWNLDYLFGVLDLGGDFTPFWAHSHAEEAVALRAFLDFVAERRRAHPLLRIYHYAPYEKTHLSMLASRHDVGVAEVAALLREGVLVDLYPIVRGALRVGAPSYSIKKLEPLYMPSARMGEVTNAGDSIVQYDLARRLHDDGDVETAQRILDEIEDYNRYDCESTLALRDWLVGLAAAEGVALRPPVAPDETPEAEPDELRDALDLMAGADARDDASVSPYALAAAALGYHAREDSAAWRDLHARLEQPKHDWVDQRGVFDVHDVEVERSWYREGKQRSMRRDLRLHGIAAPGSRFEAGGDAKPLALYEPPVPFETRIANSSAAARIATEMSIEQVDEDSMVVTEVLAKDAEPHEEVPTALIPGTPLSTTGQRAAIREWAQSLIDGQRIPRDAIGDILSRRAPRFTSGGLRRPDLDSSGEPLIVDALTDSLLRLDRSVIAVQGPPGAGKTYLAAHTIARLVERGWRIGVVGQSHAVVENLLTAIVTDAGAPAGLVGKELKTERAVPFSRIPKGKQAAFTAEHEGGGFVIGGTAWTFVSHDKFPRRSLDLLVVDEAGQFSLANTIAVGMSAENLLLLGDPQQLPQVSQGVHPAPVDESALSWVSGGAAVLPAEFGYFLHRTRRMHSAVTRHISQLSYAGALEAHPSTDARALDGVEPGLHAVPVRHGGNVTQSTDEAEAVVERVRAITGLAWTARAGEPPSPIGAEDVIVITPYNAQVECIASRLADAGFGDVRVGTVDKFQGQEAAVAIISLAASSAQELPRGIEFLLNRNRLNVAISRAKWAAYLVHSPRLLDHLPRRVEGLAAVSAFAALVRAADHTHPSA